MGSIYLDLTAEFNAGRCRAILSSGQAVVIHRLAVMSKDGDWIVAEDEQCLAHIRSVLARHGAKYRFGAPLDPRWLAGGWSSHFEFQHGQLRIRTDFVSRPPRIEPPDLATLWAEQAPSTLPVVDVRRLAELKKTNREKDYAVIGELARLMPDAQARILYSRSARDLTQLCAQSPGIAAAALGKRPALRAATQGVEALEVALDIERRSLMHANEQRLLRYNQAASTWSSRWRTVEREVAGMPLDQAHRHMLACAQDVLPYAPPNQ